MKKKGYRKYMVIVTMILLLGVGFIPSISGNTEKTRIAMDKNFVKTGPIKEDSIEDFLNKIVSEE